MVHHDRPPGLGFDGDAEGAVGGFGGVEVVVWAVAVFETAIAIGIAIVIAVVAAVGDECAWNGSVVEKSYPH